MLLVAIALVLLVISMQGNEACRILEKEEEEKYWKPKDSILLQSLRGPVPPSGNGCNNIPRRGGTPCVTNQMNFAGSAMPSPHGYPENVITFGVTAAQK